MKKFCFNLLLLLMYTTITFANSNDIGQRRIKILLDKLTPHYARVQYAGNMGAISIGTGWKYGKQKQWETDLGVGFVPKSAYDKILLVFSVRESYNPWVKDIKNSNFSISPFITSLSITGISSKLFWIKEGEKYNPPYYRFSTEIRFQLHLKSAVTYKISNESSKIKTITTYFDTSICDLMLISVVTDSYLKPKDYLSLGFGIKLNFR